jgi:hypothetical protein
MQQQQHDAFHIAAAITAHHMCSEGGSHMPVAVTADAPSLPAPRSIGAQSMQLFVATVFQPASLILEVQPGATLADLSVAAITSLLQLHPSLLRLPLIPSRMCFHHAARRFAGDDTRICSEVGLQHENTLQLLEWATSAVAAALLSALLL